MGGGRVKLATAVSAVTAALTAVMQTPALAATVDLSISVTYSDVNPQAMGGTGSFAVSIQNLTDQAPGVVTVTLQATNGAVGMVDTQGYADVTCDPPAGDGSVACQFTAFTAFDYRYLSVPVTASSAGSAPTETVTLTGTVTSAGDTDSNPADNTSSDVFTANRPTPVAITHKFLYDPDHNGGALTDPSQTAIQVFLKRTADGVPVSGQQIAVYDRPAGTNGPWYQEQYVDPGDPTYDRVIINGQSNAQGLDFKLIHDANIDAGAAIEQFTQQPRGTKVKQSVAMLSTTYGGQAVIKGSLAFVDTGTPVGGFGTITLERRAHASNDPWSKVSDVNVDYATGKFETTISPKTISDYRWRYVGQYFGAASSASAPIEVTVHQAVATSLSPVAIPPGGRATLTTAVKPGQGGQKVSLQRRTASGWQTISTRTLTSDSKQTWSFHPASTGVPVYRIVKAATTSLANGTGRAVSLTVTRKGLGPNTSYAFEDSYGGHPAAWNPCHTIGFQVNVANAPQNAVDDVKETLRRISLAGGLRFRYDGTTHVIPNPAAPQREDLVVAWRPRNSEPIFQSGAVGFGGYNQAIYRNGREVILKGFAILDADFTMTPGFGAGLAEGQLLMHELGHAMGLNHVGGNYQIMRPVLDNYLPAAMYGAGDITGLKKLGKSQGCT
jgi:hypothetical protein